MKNKREHCTHCKKIIGFTAIRNKFQNTVFCSEKCRMEFHGWTEEKIAEVRKLQQEIAEHMKDRKPRFRSNKK